jgi:hypothetical protein
MHETKVNTNHCGATPSESKKATGAYEDARAKALAHFEASASVSMTNGVFLVDAQFGAGQDHAHMRAGQLSSLLLLMRLDGAQNFRNISADRQLSLMWLASQLADELKAMLPIIADEVRREGRA